jgi:hypothetical protein
MRLAALVPIATMALQSTQLGCSFLLVKGPPSDDEPVVLSDDGGFACTETNLVPKADIALAALGGGINFVALGTATGTPPADQTAEQRHDAEVRWATMFWSGIAIASVATVSALWGFRKTRLCREYIESPRTRRALLRQREKVLQAELAGAQADP